MTEKAFDTLSAAPELEAAGIRSEQAAAIASQLGIAAKPDFTELATKSDLANLRAELYRALAIQAGAIITVTVTLVVAFARIVPSGG